MIGTKENMRVGDIVRAYDFAPRLDALIVLLLAR
jgi:hypothetical protein